MKVRRTPPVPPGKAPASGRKDQLMRWPIDAKGPRVSVRLKPGGLLSRMPAPARGPGGLEFLPVITVIGEALVDLVVSPDWGCPAG